MHGTFQFILYSFKLLALSLIYVCRYQIMDAIEGPLRRRIQEELNKVDVEKLIDDKIPEIEEQTRWIHGIIPVEETILETSTPPQDQDSQVPFSDSEENRGPS